MHKEAIGNCLKRKIRHLSSVLISILIVAVVFAPIQIVQARSTVPEIMGVSIEWIVDEPVYKEATVHVITSEGNYDFLVSGNVEQIEEETNVNLDAYLLREDGTQVYVQSANASMFDTLYGAPYAPSPDTGVETIKIHLGPLAAWAIATAIFFVIAAVFVYSVGVILGSVVLSTIIGTLQWAIFVASIPWVYITLFFGGHNPDWSLDLYIPMDEYILPTLLDKMLYVATALSWWLIAEQQLWIFTYYSATWVQPVLDAPSPPPLPPSASFAWSPDIIRPGMEVTFVSTSFDPDGEIQSWHWWFGDGSEDYGETVTHTYSQTGVYNVRLEVTDNDGLMNDTSTSLMGIPFHVIPEVPLGTIVVSATMIIALAAYFAVPKWRRKRKIADFV